MTKILLIEDEVALAAVVKRGLEKAHYQVDWYENGAEGFAQTCEEKYSLVILDLMVPGMDGWTVCQRMRTRRDSTPILMLTARDEVEDRVKGLEMGADDYLPKPFDFTELRARVAALIRRDNVHKSRVVRIADLEVDTVARQARRGGKPVPLTPREYALLEALATREGQVLSREFVQERVWDDPDSASNTVEVHIATLRRKIDSGATVKLIHTVHRHGYMICLPEEETATTA
jgi:DNA-binding response OmpR family regulator